MQATQAIAQAEPTLGKPRILIVEDSAVVGAMLRLALERHYEVEVRSTVKGASERLSAGPLPSLLLADVFLPDGTSMPLISQARAQVEGLPVVLMSGRTDDQLPDGALAADVFLPKPIRAAHLQEVIGRLVAPGRA